MEKNIIHTQCRNITDHYSSVTTAHDIPAVQNLTTNSTMEEAAGLDLTGSKENDACNGKGNNLLPGADIASRQEQASVLLESRKNSDVTMNKNRSMIINNKQGLLNNTAGLQKQSNSETELQKGRETNNTKENSGVFSGSVEGDQGSSILNPMCLISDTEELKGNNRGICYARKALKNKNDALVDSVVLHIAKAIQFSDLSDEGRSHDDNASDHNSFLGLYTDLPSVVGPIILASSLRRLQRKGVIKDNGGGMVKSTAGDYPSMLPQEVDQEELFREFCAVHKWCIPFIDQHCNRLGKHFLRCSQDFASCIDLWIDARKDEGAAYWRSTRKWNQGLDGSDTRYVSCLLLLSLGTHWITHRYLNSRRHRELIVFLQKIMVCMRACPCTGCAGAQNGCTAPKAETK